MKPDEFAAILIEKLECVKREQEAQEKLDRKLQEVSGRCFTGGTCQHRCNFVVGGGGDKYLRHLFGYCVEEGANKRNRGESRGKGKKVQFTLEQATKA